MKRLALAFLVATQLSVAAMPARAVVDTYEDSESHPLRIIAYALYPVGYIAEWVIFRPFHYLVASAGPVFGHDLHGRKPRE